MTLNKNTDWNKLVGTTVLCRSGIGNHATSEEDNIGMYHIMAVRGKLVETRAACDKNSTWYEIHDGYIGRGLEKSGFHVAVIDDDTEQTTD